MPPASQCRRLRSTACSARAIWAPRLPRGPALLSQPSLASCRAAASGGPHHPSSPLLAKMRARAHRSRRPLSSTGGPKSGYPSWPTSRPALLDTTAPSGHALSVRPAGAACTAGMKVERCRRRALPGYRLVGCPPRRRGRTQNGARPTFLALRYQPFRQRRAWGGLLVLAIAHVPAAAHRMRVLLHVRPRAARHLAPVPHLAAARQPRSVCRQIHT